MLIDFGKPRASANAIAFTPQGRIVVGGYTSNGVARPLGVRSPVGRRARSTRASAATGGRASRSAPAREQVNDLLVLPGGGIVAAGVAENGQDPRFSLIKLTGGGRLDTSFGVGRDGASMFDVTAAPDAANALAIAADGDYLLAGSGGAEQDWAIVAAHPNGVPDRAFGHEGRVVLHLAHAFEEATDIVAWGARSLVVGRMHGDRRRPRRGAPQGRRRPRHRPSAATGSCASTSSGTTDAASAAALQDNGKLVVAGQTWRGGDPAVPAGSCPRRLTLGTERPMPAGLTPRSAICQDAEDV